MPSVYLAKVNPGDAIPSFRQKGVPNLGPGVVGEVPVILHTEFFAVPHALYRYIYHCIASASLTVAETLTYYGIFKPITTLTRLFEVPPATFRFKNLTDPDRTELKAMGLQQDLTNGNLFVGTPAIHNLARLNTMSPDDDRTRPGHINFEGYFAWVYLMKGIQIYTTAKNSLAKNGFNIKVNGAGTVDKGVTGHLNSLDGKTTAFENNFDIGVANYGGAFVLVPPSDNSLSTFPGSFIDVNNHKFDKDPMSGHKGIFFPFFSGMCLADKTTAYEIFASLFQGSLAPTEASDTKILQRVRVGTRQISFSRSGMAIAHIYKVFGISMGICGAKVHVITKGSAYVGTVIEGTFAVSIYGERYASGLIAPEIEKVNLLESQAQDICDKLNAVQNAKGLKPYSFTKPDFLSSRKALTAFNNLDFTLFHSTNTIQEVRHILENMEFNDTFPVPNQSLISTCVQFMLSKDSALLQDQPAYLGGGVLENQSRTFEALSMFGPKVPTFNTGKNKGTMFIIPSPGKTDTNITKDGNGVRPLHYLPFWVKSIGAAVVEWDEVIRTGKFTIPSPRKGKKEFTNLHEVVVSLAQDPMFTEVYGNIKKMVGEARLAGMQTGKRKRDADGDDRGGKKSKKREVDSDDI